MSQDEINEAEWRNPDNWSGGYYFSKKDSRVWVPKQLGGGWIMNLGQKKGAAWMTGMFVAASIAIVLAIMVVLIWSLRNVPSH